MGSQDSGPKVATLGFHLESNAFAPVSEERHFRSLCYLEGEDLLREARKAVSALPAEMPGFYREMDALGGWTPVPIIVTACEPGGPVDEAFFQATLRAMRGRLAAAGATAAPACVYASQAYSQGSISCQDRNQYRCDNGVWSRTANAC